MEYSTHCRGEFVSPSSQTIDDSIERRQDDPTTCHNDDECQALAKVRLSGL